MSKKPITILTVAAMTLTLGAATAFADPVYDLRGDKFEPWHIDSREVRDNIRDRENMRDLVRGRDGVMHTRDGVVVRDREGLNIRDREGVLNNQYRAGKFKDIDLDDADILDENRLRINQRDLRDGEFRRPIHIDDRGIGSHPLDSYEKNMPAHSRPSQIIRSDGRGITTPGDTRFDYNRPVVDPVVKMPK